MHSYAIKQASELSGLPESTLRFYETIGLIKPINRDHSTKHRVYSEDDINMVISIACLNATGMSIEEMRTYLRNRSRGSLSAPEQIQLLENQRHRLKEEAQNLKLRRKYVDVKINYWEAVSKNNKKEIEITKKKAAEIARALKLPKEIKVLRSRAARY